MLSSFLYEPSTLTIVAMSDRQALQSYVDIEKQSISISSPMSGDDFRPAHRYACYRSLGSLADAPNFISLAAHNEK